MEGGEGQAQVNYEQISRRIPAAHAVMMDEEKHERELVSLIDEERLKYVGAVIRGLNEALIELTAALSGLTLALHNPSYIALAGLVTGLAMTFSLGGTEYLATKSEGSHHHPVKAALYTSAANLVTVVFLIYPYFIFSNPYYSLGLMLISAVLVIYIFNYYVSTVRGLDIRRTFTEMFFVSLGISVLAFIIGYLARIAFHLDL
jgi:vacuolar iron transporter family protein